MTDAERYRRIIEAYQIENDFGRNIETYLGELEIGGKTRQVNFLRIGRVALLYQTLDESATGVWDQKNQTWLDASEHRNAVQLGLRMAKKQTAPDMLRLPVRTAEAAQ